MSEIAEIDRVLVELSKDPKVQQVVADAHLFDSLRAQPGWQRLYSMVRAKRDRWMMQITKRFMGPKKGWPDTHEIAFYRGYYLGALWIVSHPEMAEQNLERVAQVAWAMTLEGDE